MSSRSPMQGSERGFTLVEILLAVALVATMATLVFGSLSATTNVMDAVRANVATEQTLRSMLQVMADELSVGFAQPQTPWMGVNAQLDGQPADSIAFLSMGQYRGADQTRGTEVVRIVYTREGDKLVRFVRNNLYGQTDESIEQLVLATKVKAFNVRYHDGTAPLWLDEWDGRARQNRTPSALLLELTMILENRELRTFREWISVGVRS